MERYTGEFKTKEREIIVCQIGACIGVAYLRFTSTITNLSVGSESESDRSLY